LSIPDKGVLFPSDNEGYEQDEHEAALRRPPETGLIAGGRSGTLARGAGPPAAPPPAKQAAAALHRTAPAPTPTRTRRRAGQRRPT